jgi:phosphoglucosamine mutase
LKPKLFGSSGIRGLANSEITVTLSQRVGQAVATLHEGGCVVVGRDVRLTGLMFENALLSGLASGGADSLVLGIVPTPVAAWTTNASDSDAGVAISASHNPPEYNGLKLFNCDGMSLTSAEQFRLEKILEEGSYKLVDWDGVGRSEQIDAVQLYVDEVLGAMDLNTSFKVACDLFNGATSVLAPLAFHELGVDAEYINAVVDGRFPSGNPEPDPVSLIRLGRFVRARGFDIGFGFDGDGDRMMPLNREGVVVSPDRVLAAYAGYAVERAGGGVVITHVGASMNIDDVVQGAGGSIVRTPVGDSFITEAIVKYDAVFGGEPVGAWVMPEVHLCPDGVLAALKLLEALDYTGSTIDEFIEDVPEFPISRAKIECPNSLKLGVMKGVEEGYDTLFEDVQNMSLVDGVRLDMDRGWVLIRPSGTEPIIRITVEGREEENVNELLEKGKLLVREALVKVK